MKRIDLLLETVARIRPQNSFKLLILAGGDFTPFAKEARRLGIEDRILVREKVSDIEDYLQAADLGLFTSDTESFCLSILEAMCFGCPSVARRVGGIREVIEDNVSGQLVDSENPQALAAVVGELIADSAKRRALGTAAKKFASEKFSADVIVPRYEAIYRKVGG